MHCVNQQACALSITGIMHSATYFKRSNLKDCTMQHGRHRRCNHLFQINIILYIYLMTMSLWGADRNTTSIAIKTSQSTHQHDSIMRQKKNSSLNFLSCFAFNFLGQITWCQTWTSLQDQTKFSLSWGTSSFWIFKTDFPCQLLWLTDYFVVFVVSYQLLLSFLLVRPWAIAVTGTCTELNMIILCNKLCIYLRVILSCLHITSIPKLFATVLKQTVVDYYILSSVEMLNFSFL